jgi:predicted DNA-binding transcriptional regulator AlpA
MEQQPQQGQRYEPWQYLTTSQLASWLNLPSRNTIYHWRQFGQGPRGRRVGKRVLFLVADVEAWLDGLGDDWAALA